MKPIILALLVASGGALSGCAGIPLSGANPALGEALLKDLQGCTRDYNGGVGAGITLSVQIHCDPVQPPPTAIIYFANGPFGDLG